MAKKYTFEMDDEGNLVEGSVAPWEEPTPAPAGVPSPQYTPEEAGAVATFTNPGAASEFLDEFRRNAGYREGDAPADDPLMEAGYRQEKFYTDPMLAYSRFITGPQKVGPILWLGGSPVPIPPPAVNDTTALLLSSTEKFLRALAEAKKKKTVMQGGTGGAP